MTPAAKILTSTHRLMCTDIIPGDDSLPPSIVNMESHTDRSRRYTGIPLWDVPTRAILDRGCTASALPDLSIDRRATAVVTMAP